MRNLFFPLILFLFFLDCFAQASNPVVLVENIDLSIDPVYNGWIHNQDTFAVYKLSLNGDLNSIFNNNVSGIYGFKCNILYDPSEIVPVLDTSGNNIISDINNPGWLLVANYVGIDYAMIGYGTNISLSISFFVAAGGFRMMTIEFTSSSALDSSILDYCNNTLMYLPFLIQNPCSGGTYNIQFWDGYDSGSQVYLNPAQQNSFMLSYNNGISFPNTEISVEDSTLNVISGSIIQPQFDANVFQNGNMLELIVSGGTMPYYFQWFDESMNAIIGENYSIFYPNQNGFFYYEITDINGCFIRDSINVSFLGLINYNIDINIYNDLFSNNIHFSIPKFSEYNMIVRNILGKVVFVKNNITSDFVLDDYFERGVYIIEIFNNDNRFAKKIIYGY